MPSVIIICKTLLKGGAEKQALTLAKLLKGEENGVIVISWCGDQIDNANLAFIEKNSLKYIGLKGNLLSKFLHFNRIIRREKISLIFSYLTLANFVAGLSKLFNRHLITIGGIRTEQFPFYKLIFEKFVHNHLNDATVFNNYAAKAKFGKKGFREAKIYVIHNSIQVPAMEDRKKSGEEIRIISVCRFVPPKDFRTALNSFKKLTEKNRDKNLKYLLAGWGPMEGEIRAMAGDLGLDNVEILINPPGIRELLKSGDIYLSTSLFEGLSNSIMEAMAAGLPVVATDVGDSRSLVRDGINGFIIQCRDADAASEKLDWLVNNEASRIEFGSNSYKIVMSEFSEAILLDKYRKVISELNTGGVSQDRRAAV
jgi:glycosyltransferase involved in cell wall biosynthesis